MQFLSQQKPAYCVCVFYVVIAFQILLPLPINEVKIHASKQYQFLHSIIFSHIVSQMFLSKWISVIWDNSYLPPINGQSIGPSKSSIYYRQKVRSITPCSHDFSRTEPISEKYIPRKSSDKSKMLILGQTYYISQKDLAQAQSLLALAANNFISFICYWAYTGSGGVGECICLLSIFSIPLI